MEPLTHGYYLGRLRGELARHPHLKGWPMPTVNADEFAVWLERDGIVLARVEERSPHRRWWGTGKLIEVRQLAHELVTVMRERKPTDAEIVSDLMRGTTGI